MKKLLFTLCLAATPLFGQQLVSDLTVQRTVKLTGDISPTQLAANTNDWAPTGFSTAYRVRASTDASRNLTGLAGGTGGRIVVLANVGSFALVLKEQSASSAAANRFALGGADVTLAAGASVELIYDGTSSRWRMTGASGSAGTVTASGGSLTSNAVVLGAGTTDVKVVVGVTTDGTSKLNLGVAGSSVGGVVLANATSGTVEIRPVTGALGTSIISTPAASDTMALLAATQTFTNKTHTSPKIGTSILDTNGNALLTLTATSSAVNALTLANAATAGFPMFTASGSDTNIGAMFKLKGTGRLHVYGDADAAVLGIGRNGGAYWYFLGGDSSSNLNIFDNDGTTVRLQIVQSTGGLNIPSSTASTTTGTGSAIFGGGIGVAGQVTAGGAFKTTNSTASTSTTTGSGIFAGGVGIAGAVYVGGDFVPAQTNGIVGTTTNNDANAGSIGQYVHSEIAVESAVSLTTNTGANITSISLTAGDWEVSGNVNFSAATATVTGTSGGITITTGTVPTDGTEVYSGVQVTLLSETDSVTLSPKRFSLSGTTTVYLVGQSIFSAGSVSGFGSIKARRVR